MGDPSNEGLETASPHVPALIWPCEHICKNHWLKRLAKLSNLMSKAFLNITNIKRKINREKQQIRVIIIQKWASSGFFPKLRIKTVYYFFIRGIRPSRFILIQNVKRKTELKIYFHEYPAVESCIGSDWSMSVSGWYNPTRNGFFSEEGW